MERMDTMIRWGAAVFGGLTSFLFGGWSSLLSALVLFVVIDYVTGMLAAGKEGKLSSQVGRWGIVRKVAIFLVVAVAYHVDRVLGDGTVIRDAVICFYLANELLSILENAGRLGLPVPSFIRRAAEVLREKANEAGRRE